MLAYPLTLQFRGGGYTRLEAVPTTYIIDRAGVIRYARSGALEREDFAALIDPLLDRAPPP